MDLESVFSSFGFLDELEGIQKTEYSQVPEALQPLNNTPLFDIQEKEKEEKEKRIEELQAKLEHQEKLLRLNHRLQNMLEQQLSCLNRLLLKDGDSSSLKHSKASPFFDVPPDADIEIRKQMSLELIRAFPLRNSSRFFSLSKGQFPHWTSAEGHLLKYVQTNENIFRWSKEDDEKLSALVHNQCMRLVDNESIPQGQEENLEEYKRTEDTERKVILFNQMMPSLVNYFSWDQIAHLVGTDAVNCFVRWLNVCDPLLNQQAWTLDEDSTLLRLVETNRARDWVSIANSLGTCRSPFQCFEHFVKVLEMPNYNKKWTKEEDELILEGVKKYGKNWLQIAHDVPKRTGPQCRSRYYQSLLYISKRGRWSDLEKTRLLLYLFFYGLGDWKRIASCLQTRNVSQCRDQWVNVLYPENKRTPWSKAEIQKLKKLIKNKDQVVWKDLCKFFPGRTADAIKTRGRSLL